nr:microtubule-associated protein 1B-like [Onthophagus taurus]
MSWNSVTDTRPITLPAQTMSSPSPPLTTQSASPVTSATTSPQHIPYEINIHHPAIISSSPVAVRAAVHRADTGTLTRTRTTTVVRTPSSHKSEGFLDHRHSPPPLTNSCPSQTQSQNDLDAARDAASGASVVSERRPVPSKRRIWQRSASCRDLYDFSFEDSGQAKRRIKPPKPAEKVEERKLESPVTRYDDHRVLYESLSRNTSLEIHQDIMVPDQKVYSSSYPGTTPLYSQESVEDPGNYDLRDSQDDLSHDSYELLERSDDDYSTSGDYKYRKAKQILNTRSCSLDSGNYLPSDTDSDNERKLKCKSSSDVHADIFSIEDPRDFPREIIPRKSDGSFYKAFKLGSRTSSLESKSDYYESKSRSSKESLKKRERSLGSRTSSQESKSDYDIKKQKAADTFRKAYIESRTSSLDSRSEYYDATSLKHDESKPKYHHDYDRKIQFERNYGTHISISKHENSEMNRNYSLDFNSIHTFKETSHVHSISLQNVETEQNIRIKNFEQNTIPRTQKQKTTPQENDSKDVHIWPESIPGLPTKIPVIRDWTSKSRSTESESNIFSFDEDKIQSLQESDIDVPFGVVPNIDIRRKKSEKPFRDIFVEIEPRKGRESIQLHQPIERTKSDPNSLARQRLNSNSRRLLLKHQKSIDLTPAESSDEDYLYKQIPSAPPIMKYRGSQFEMPSAEFGHFDILKREIEGQKTKFEVPKSQFEILGAKTQSDFINLPPKNDVDIPYVLHKRHVMNGTASKEEPKKEVKKEPKKESAKGIQEVPDVIEPKKLKPKSPIEPEKTFLFTQNIDLSKVDPVTLEIDKSVKPIQHMSSPKRDITKIDPAILEALNSKLSQIESDSPTSSKTESLKPSQKIKPPQEPIIEPKVEILKKIDKIMQKNDIKATLEKIEKPKPKDKLKTDMKKRVIKPRMQPNKKGGKTNKTKVRITSFSSDDESLDSDDVFGSAEATPTKMEFSPPQMRKEMESILKFESERKYLQYTMSSTEVEGSPPQTRKSELLLDRTLDPNYQTELRRISERSLSIPSSEDDLNIKTSDMAPVFAEPSVVSEGLSTVPEDDGDKSVDDTVEQVTVQELLGEEDLKSINETKEKEKQLLQADIEKDLKDLKVPPKTKITEICSPSLRRKGQSPLLFAHARLNLSEGSAFSLLQKQQSSEAQLLSGRRTKSLDAPVISVNRLPPLNAFSSKDDTVEEEDQCDLILKESDTTDYESPTKPKEFIQKSVESDEKSDIEKSKPEMKLQKERSKENDQIVPDVSKDRKKSTQKMPLSKTKPSPQKISKEKELKPKPPLPQKAAVAKPPKLPLRTSNGKPLHKSLSGDKPDDPNLPKQKSLPTQASLTLPEIKRTKSQELELQKKLPTKEKARSLERLELKRISSKERTKSQEESDTEAKRKEKQQMLYETAIKQTKTIKSPVKDTLPVFPQVEEMVRERGGKLEISINTIENNTVSLEEAIIITKSPKKLDKKIDKKLTKSLELNLTGDEEEESRSVQRLGKSLDLDNRPEKETSEFDFDFQPDLPKDEEPAKQEDEHSSDNDDTLRESEMTQDIILEGTSLDVWLSVEEVAKDDKLDNITVLQKSADFFEHRPTVKPPDLAKIDTKSSSDSQSMEKMSLGNSLDIKYIDDSGDSSHKSEKDAQITAELRKASQTVEKLLMKKLEKKRMQAELSKKESEEKTEEKTLVHITSDESLTSVSELKGEKESFLHEVTVKLTTERSRSEDNTGSWITVECEEYVGTEESFDYDVQDEKDDKEDQKTEDSKTDDNLLTTEIRSSNKIELLKRSSDQSRSSDTTGSWTSGEKDLSPGHHKETEESSVSCSMGRAIGLSQTIEKFASRDQIDKTSPDLEPPRSPRSPRICVLGRAFTIDEASDKEQESEDSISDAHDIPKDLTPIQEVQDESNETPLKYKKKPYPFEEKWSNDSELSQKLQQKICKKLSSSERNGSSVDDSFSESKRNNKLFGEKLSTESRNSLDTESSSGSLGVAVRMQKSGDNKEFSSTWKQFPLESSGSSSLEEGIMPPDQDLYGQEYFLSRENSSDFTTLADITYMQKDNDITPTKDDDEPSFPSAFNCPCLTSVAITDVLHSYGTTFLSRTLSRISERSTNSEKSSVDEDSTKASTQSDSLHEESGASSDRQVSISSDSPSNAAHVSDSDKKSKSTNNSKIKKETSKPSDKISEGHLPNINNLLQRQISDDRRTSAEMADLSIDEIEIITSERGLKLRRQGSDDTVIDEECFEDRKRSSSSQESEEWPLPDIPQTKQPLLALHEFPSSDTSQQTTQVYQPPKIVIPKTFGLRGSLKSQESEQWPSPPSSVAEPVIGNIETYYVNPPEEAYKTIVESGSTVSTYENDSNSDNSNRTLDMDAEKTHTYENVAADIGSESLSESLSAGPSGVKIVLEKKSESPSSNSEEILNDDVFTDCPTTGELRPPTAMRKSTTSDDSSHSGHKTDLKPPSRKASHSSYSDEDCTSSIGTTLEDGTVRYALKPTKCTHSSHSEDTSIALSLSEWSNSTNTVKFQNLSTSNSNTKSSGLKSDDNSLTDIAQSISEWSSSNSNTMKAQSLQFQKLSSSTGDSSTLTEMIPTISDWSSSESKTLVAQVNQAFFNPPPPIQEQRQIRLGSSVDDVELSNISDVKSPQNIPSEDAVIRGITREKSFTKSTERPMVIPSQILSESEKSTESSSMEQRTVHVQKYDKEKQKYLQKTKSTERPVKVPLKLSKCSPYYSSSLSSESTPLASTASVSKTATVPLTRVHKKSLLHGKSPPSENDSTSSMESPKSKSETRRGYRRRRQTPQKRYKNEKEHPKEEYFYVEQGDYNQYLANRSVEEMVFQYDISETSPAGYIEEGYFPDGDSQSGSDIFRMERDEDDRCEIVEGFDVTSIPPPLIEDDFEAEKLIQRETKRMTLPDRYKQTLDLFPLHQILSLLFDQSELKLHNTEFTATVWIC